MPTAPGRAGRLQESSSLASIGQDSGLSASMRMRPLKWVIGLWTATLVLNEK